MRRTLVAVFASAALTIIASAVVTATVEVGYAASAATPAVTTTAPAWEQLPACDDDAPDITVGPRCVWEDDGTYWVVGHGRQQDYPSCATEDSVTCVWDSASRGVRRVTVDSPTRFLVNY